MWRSVAVAVTLTFVVVPAAFAQHITPPPSPQEAELRRAQNLINAEQFKDALILLRALAPRHSRPLDVYFMLGLAALETADRSAEGERTALLAEAVAVLHGILVVYPDFHRARLELARAFFLQGEDELATEHFERVLAAAPNIAAAARIRQFLLAIRARKRWSGYFSFAVAPDSNVNNATEQRTITFFGIPFQLSDGARRQSGLGALLSAGGEYKHPLSRRWQWRTGVDLAHNDYGNDNFDQTHTTLKTGPRFLPSPQTDLSVLAVGGQRWIAAKRYSREFGVRLEANRRLSDRLAGGATAGWKKTFHRQGESADGVSTDGRLSLDYFMSPTTRFNMYWRLSRARPRTVASRNRGASVGGGGQWLLPAGWSVGANAEWTRTRYQGGALGTDGAARADRGNTIVLYAFNRSFTIFGFSPQLSAVREKHKSNATLSRYRRNRGEVRLVRQF